MVQILKFSCQSNENEVTYIIQEFFSFFHHLCIIVFCNVLSFLEETVFRIEKTNNWLLLAENEAAIKKIIRWQEKNKLPRQYFSRQGMVCIKDNWKHKLMFSCRLKDYVGKHNVAFIWTLLLFLKIKISKSKSIGLVEKCY